MADLNIMKALKDPELELQTMLNPPAAGSATETAISVVTPDPTLEESLNDFDPEQYVEDTELAASSPEQLPKEAIQPPAQDALCTFHPNSTYKQTELELVAIENWMEQLHLPRQRQLAGSTGGYGYLNGKRQEDVHTIGEDMLGMYCGSIPGYCKGWSDGNFHCVDVVVAFDSTTCCPAALYVFPDILIP
jgi:hypothetical protein